MIELQITETDHLRPLESFLRNLFPDATPGYVTTLIRKGHASVSTDRPPARLLATGDIVRLKESAKTLSLMEKRPRPVDIIHEDSDIIVINKPSGVAMHRTGRDEETVIDRVSHLFHSRGLSLKPRPVNRLDRGTSGVVILAKGGKAAGIYGRMIKGAGFEKRYLAVCHGDVREGGEITTPIEGKEATTRFEVIATTGTLSLLLVTPFSQIRIHLSLSRHPIVGDRRYGGVVPSEPPGFFLHSLQTAVSRDGGKRSFVAPLPPHFLDVIKHSFAGAEMDIMTHLLGLVSSSIPTHPHPTPGER
ncbi:MAG: RluA family pseudouridine synthase [Desulfuromonadia bacterium]